MTQRQIPHEEPLPACRAGHAARHIFDARRPGAGGGHLVECACSQTRKHAEFADALAAWKRMHRIRTPRPRPAANVVQLGLRLGGGHAR
ncbi:hypothetical protein [Vulcaniibacterium tengchongense]|uniref:Uncharacterized protein n=1 Tax=Vulcaniibacterium tengchongense TaxID=1273429 RepID=A0A3N4V4M1_9GAMM|nr:hypothetical protein [Vulcaniibacterium tengchongense]RPE74659.1 hypothetical protein EDC50_3188 [Vulcaniibacterium tengchongense]